MDYYRRRAVVAVATLILYCLARNDMHRVLRVNNTRVSVVPIDGHVGITGAFRCACDLILVGSNWRGTKMSGECPVAMYAHGFICTQTTMKIVVLLNAERWLLAPLSTFIAMLHEATSDTDRLFVTFTDKLCPSRQPYDFESTSNATLSGTLGYPTGSLDWWRIVVNSVGFSFSYGNFNRSKCLLQFEAISSRGCGCICDSDGTLNVTTIRGLAGISAFVTPRHAQRSCALVTNAGILGSVHTPPLGILIDAHPFVIRLNNGPAHANVKAYVGSKTNLRVAWPVERMYEVIRDEPTLFSIYRPSEENSLNRAFNHSLLQRDQVAIIPKLFREHIQKKCLRQKHGHASTGVNALAIALLMCKKVVIFGKSETFSTFDDTFEAHYFEKHASMRSSRHDWDIELEMFKKLKEQKHLTMIP
jgi:hypothetical protein